jgi:2-desacetyl-2-hydroxyethyl bacteriochlorophyllide A dehydrogenase
MKALVFERANEAVVTERPVPAAGPGEVLIRSRAVGICHSDFELLADRYIVPFEYPVVPGHEWAGEVVAAGSGVTGLAAGDKVVGECVVGPGGRDHFGFSIDGANAEFFVARAEWLHRLPASVSWTAGALVEPLSVAYNATRSAGRIDPADTVAVLGGGPIGLLCVMAAAACGAGAVLIEPQAPRRAWAERAGARLGLDPGAGDYPEAVREITGGRGFDVVIEAAGAPAAMADALRIAGQRARLVFAGIDAAGTAPAALGLIQAKELRVRGMIGSAGVWPETIRLLASGLVDPTILVTRRFPLTDAVAALAAARDTSGNVKVHIEAGG